MVKLAIIDNQHIFREGLQGLIEAEKDIEIIVSENHFSQIDEELLEEVDIFLIDIENLKEEQAFISRSVLELTDNKKLVALSNEASDENVKQAVLAGCHGFLLKEMSYPKFIQAIRMIADQGAFIHPHVLQYIIEDYRQLSKGSHSLSKTGAQDRTRTRVCTKRESEILQLLVDGNDNISIAESLNISEKTVKNHLTNIFRKLDVKDRTQAAVLAIRNQWVHF